MERLGLPVDSLVFEVSRYLLPIDLYSLAKGLSLDIPHFLFENRIKTAITERLKKIFGKRYSEFKTIMERSLCFLSGPFIIRTVLNDVWKTGLDIYLPTRNFGFDFNYTTNLSQFFKRNYRSVGYKNCQNSKTSDRISRLEKWYCFPRNVEEKYNIGIITLHYLDLEKDPSIIGNYFTYHYSLDLFNCLYNYNSSRAKVRVPDIVSIFDRRINFDNYKISRKLFERINFYTENGFYLDPNLDLQQTFFDYVDNFSYVHALRVNHDPELIRKSYLKKDVSVNHLEKLVLLNDSYHLDESLNKELKNCPEIKDYKYYLDVDNISKKSFNCYSGCPVEICFGKSLTHFRLHNMYSRDPLFEIYLLVS